MVSHDVLLYGNEKTLTERRFLRAGPLTVMYEAGELRSIRVGEQELILRVFVAVRDQNWTTVPLQLSNVQIEEGQEDFHITFDAAHRQNDIAFSWQGTIRGTSQGTITFAMKGQAETTFLRNRIGICILHPMLECAGRACRVEQGDGTIIEGHFPELIAPYQPFTNIRVISYEVIHGTRVEIRLLGDLFEMEDQRNWTDASFKTYSTPLSLPFPVTIEQGTPVEQTMILTLQREYTANVSLLEAENAIQKPVEVVVGDLLPQSLPRIGLSLASHPLPLTSIEVERLRALHCTHLRVDLDLADPAYVARLHRATEEARALDVPLEVALHLSENASMQLEIFMALLEAVRPRVSAWLIFHNRERSTTAQWIELARPYLQAYDSEALIGSGTNMYFAELNRGRPPIELLDLICYSVNPQVHAFDNLSLMETVAAQAETLKSAHTFAAGRPVAVTPVTLKPRFNADATGPVAEPAPGDLPFAVDVRQMSLFGACWTLGSIRSISLGGAYSATYYETTGWRGVMETAAGSPLPAQFPSLAGSVFPLYHVLADVGAYAGAQLVALQSARPLQVEGLALSKAGALRILLANMSDVEQEVQLTFTDQQQRRCLVRQLDEGNVLEAMTNPEIFRQRAGSSVEIPGGRQMFTLPPYALLCLDSREEGYL